MNVSTKKSPFLGKKAEFLKALRNNQVIVLHGPPGSGKTTEGLKALLEAGYGELGVIGNTQPRRLSTVSVTSYISSIVSPESSDRVRHKIRFDDETDDRTLVKVMTDGILLQEFLYDRNLSKYSVIMIDEAHERSRNIDFLLGLLKQLLPRRPDFRLIISSATIDTEKFSKFFDDAPIIKIEGQMYPVEIRYSDVRGFSDRTRDRDFVREAVNVALDIHKNEGDGDILVFLSGKDDIRSAIFLLEESKVEGVEILPAYGRMDVNDQSAVFLDYPGKRKIILATNVAETSITPVGVRFVVDPGFIKEMRFDPRTRVSRLIVVPHSKSGVDQRAGRVGRVEDGIVYRLYTEDEHQALPLYTRPEIQRSSLSSIVLLMLFFGISDIEQFEFIDRPGDALIKDSFEELRSYGALNKSNRLTEYGKNMAKLPLDPYLSNLLLSSVKEGCVDEIATIVSAISAQGLLLRPPGEEKEADLAHKVYEPNVFSKGIHSDVETFLNIWNVYRKNPTDEDLFFAGYLSSKALLEIKDVRNDLIGILKTCGVAITRCSDINKIGRAILSALRENLYRRRGKSYLPVFAGKEGREAFIHPSSVLYRALPEYLVAMEVVQTSRLYLRHCTAVDPSCLPQFGISQGKDKDAEEKGKKKNTKSKKKSRFVGKKHR